MTGWYALRVSFVDIKAPRPTDAKILVTTVREPLGDRLLHFGNQCWVEWNVQGG